MGIQGQPDDAVKTRLGLHTGDGIKAGGMSSGWRPWGIGDIKLELLKRMRSEDVAELDRLRMRVMMEQGHSWKKASVDFKVRSRFVRFLASNALPAPSLIHIPFFFFRRLRYDHLRLVVCTPLPPLQR